jgi:hypothetical protein
MCKGIWTITKINIKTLASAYWGTGVTIGVFLIQTLVFGILIANGVFLEGSRSEVSIGNALWLLPVIAAVQIPAYNFRRIIHLGGKREHFFWGSMACYAVLAGVASFVSALIYYTYDRFLIGIGYGVILNAADAFGWLGRGVFSLFFQQFAFLFLFAAFVHTLTAMFGKWYGWITNITIVAIISVFTPIAPLRAVLVGFFHLILFADPLVQITVCLTLALISYAFSKFIFARKAI